ncbi:MAG: enoyl-CoA hydratase/isomerase family protein [Gammaproteobacteria bacterium]|nr:enoyl-CoA hydratase/isomerase family protein [Gammaproteobacteria bacterium]
MAYQYNLLKVDVQGRVATVTVENPPINLITMDLFTELSALSLELEADPALTVVVLRSADPDFFLAHFDVETLLALADADAAAPPAEQNEYHAMCERFRTMNKVTIACIEGRVGGGGSELAASFDMRFGVRGRTIVNQMEVPLGILPGGTGTQRLPRLVGRARALEIILGANDLDAETAERWGYLNRVFEADAIGPFVDALAQRIASFPAEAVRLAKASVDHAESPLAEGLPAESRLFQELLHSDAARANMQRFLEVGGQTRDGELRVAELSGELGERH